MKLTKTHVFSPEYKYKMFLLWYKEGRPGMEIFSKMVAPDDVGSEPALSTLKSWQSHWKTEAEILDSQIRTELEKRMVKEKVEMLSRHADLGKKMQEIGIDFINALENLKNYNIFRIRYIIIHIQIFINILITILSKITPP